MDWNLERVEVDLTALGLGVRVLNDAAKTATKPSTTLLDHHAHGARHHHGHLRRPRDGG